MGGGPGGFYTKQDYADLVRYAQDRYITVVPEIDMPGHTNAAIAAYPQLGCSDRRRAYSAGRSRRGSTRARRWGGACSAPTARVVYKFVDDVVKELAAMTPGPYIHLGGDEVHVLQLPQYVKFVERVQDIVYNNGKTYMGWEEVGRGRMRPTTVVQQWKSDSVPPAVTQGAKVVMSPANKTYLDMKYDRGTELGLTWAAIIELRPAYEWEPTTYMKGVREDQILGVEGALWSETVQQHRLGALHDAAAAAGAGRGGLDGAGGEELGGIPRADRRARAAVAAARDELLCVAAGGVVDGRAWRAVNGLR